MRRILYLLAEFILLTIPLTWAWLRWGSDAYTSLILAVIDPLYEMLGATHVKRGPTGHRFISYVPFLVLMAPQTPNVTSPLGNGVAVKNDYKGVRSPTTGIPKFDVKAICFEAGSKYAYNHDINHHVSGPRGLTWQIVEAQILGLSMLFSRGHAGQINCVHVGSTLLYR